jgi:hypothetical protein
LPIHPLCQLMAFTGTGISIESLPDSRCRILRAF